MTLPPESPSEPHADPGEVTRLLHLARDGDREALDRLVPLVYEDLRRMAHRQLDREGGGHTLQTTGLLHEAYLKLAGSGAAQAAKRGGGIIYATLGDAAEPVDASVEDLLALNDALEQLEPRQRQVIECRFFGGMEEADIAAALGVSERTVRRDWVKARAWLQRALSGVERSEGEAA